VIARPLLGGISAYGLTPPDLIRRGNFMPRANRRPAARHCERSEAIHVAQQELDCFVACAPRNDDPKSALPVETFRRRSGLVH